MSDDPATDSTKAERSTAVTALVVLRPPGGGSAVGSEPISRLQLDQIMPTDDDVGIVAEGFAAAGFDVSPMLGISMSITATCQTFEDVFGVAIEPDGATWKVIAQPEPDRASNRESDRESDREQSTDEIPLDAVDTSIAGRVDRVLFEPTMTLDEESTWTF